jgi:hypothetical protein
MEKISLIQIVGHIERIRRSVGPEEPLYTNYFRQNLPGNVFSTLISDSGKTVVFLQIDEGLDRVFFMTSDSSDLTTTLEKLPARPLALDYVTKELEEELKNALLKAGFNVRAEFGRIINFGFEKTASQYEPVIATITDVKPLLARMNKDFDIFIDHLCDYKTLTSLVEMGQVLLNVKEEKIKGYLLYEVQNKKSFIRAWYNADNFVPMGGMLLLGAFHRLMTRLYVTSTYGWVDVENDSAVMVYRRFGYSFDGLKDIIMARQ